MVVPFSVLRESLASKQHCWGCGTKNPASLLMEFEGNSDEEGLDVTWDPDPALTGPTGIVHGGAQATAMDCLAVLTAAHWAARRRMDPVPLFVTADMAVHYHRPVVQGQPLALVAQVTKFEPRRLGVSAEIWDAESQMCTKGEFTLHRTDHAWGPNPYIEDKA